MGSSVVGNCFDHRRRARLEENGTNPLGSEALRMRRIYGARLTRRGLMMVGWGFRPATSETLANFGEVRQLGAAAKVHKHGIFN
jgi:hypothetical protein